MLTVHHLNNSRSQRVLWLLEELGLPYEIVRYQRQGDMRAPNELRAIHALGKSPVVTDNGNTIAESGAIVEYLVGTYGNGRFVPAANTPERLRYTYWLHYAEGSAMPPLLMSLVFTTVKKKTPWPVKPIAKVIADSVFKRFINPQLKTHFDWIESELGKRTWFAGDELTAADIQMSYGMEAIAARVPDAPQRIKDWVARAHERPAYKRALERGGAYEIE